ncbi:MAG: 5-carboxymethyl-2-hydroxymuconate Delta-isomerase [Bdellovibrionales bacterium]
MPHIIVEYSDHLALDIPALLHDLHHDLAGRETVDINAIKTRAIPIKNCVVADADTANSFIHVSLKLLPGRDAALKANDPRAL